jgi:hypothetical protein
MLRSCARFATLSSLLTLASCGGNPPPAAATPSTAPSAEASAEPAAAPAAPEEKPLDKLPTECADKGKLCLPPPAFVKKLCAGWFPDIALAMLSKSAPWSHGFLKVRSAEAWNASGGQSSGEKIVFEEEFVLLSRREASTGGIQVSGAGGGYDVLRWDGTCASLQDEEVSLTGSSTPKAAKIPWKNLGDKVQETLLANEKINKIYMARRKECKGATIGEVSSKCEKLDYVRNGGAMPPPAKLP